ncbi:MAG TPA: NAD(P)H-dependent oxidoreductase subunit E, partial [Spirochaetota bacterium]|nr:NAD(P)H-dependent oxidoreductase subunit E [Spirochaetota bacterium]
GKYIFKICKGTACHIKGAKRLINEIEQYLGIKEGETTPDGLIKLETSSCLGVCALSPVLIINDKTYVRVNSKIVKSLIDEIRAENFNG